MPKTLKISKSVKELTQQTDPFSTSQKLLRKIDIFLNIKNKNLKNIKNINFEEYELKNE